jgi:predicted enzyme related to lactoylglutathione lyase
MARITHFEIPANEPEKLTAFYETVFGWKFSKWGMSRASTEPSCGGNIRSSRW